MRLLKPESLNDGLTLSESIRLWTIALDWALYRMSRCKTSRKMHRARLRLDIARFRMVAR